MRIPIASGLVLALAVCVSAQDEPAVMPVFEHSGDSPAEFKIDVKLSHEPDMTSPTEVVEAWNAATDQRDSIADRVEPLMARWDELINGTMVAAEKQILSKERYAEEEDRRNATEEEKERYISTRGAVRIVRTQEQEDGSRMVFARQITESKRKGEDGEWSTSTRESHFRYRLVKSDDGTWLIDTMERGQEARDSTPENPSITWRDERNQPLEVWYERDELADDFSTPEVDNTTPEKAALSFVDGMRSFYVDADFRFRVMAILGLAELTKDWFTEAHKESVKKNVEERRARSKDRGPQQHEVAEVRDETETSATVVFKQNDPRDDRALVVKLVKEGDSWRVNELGHLRAFGTDDESYVPRDDLYVRW